ncbi:MAG: hypothetical protein JNJ73_09940 [Hyphomonadaceae bacterium]|nr:hypothetical protein [Hyphomonadaceae bacterium]
MSASLTQDLSALGIAYVIGVAFLALGYAFAGHVWVERHSIHLPGPARVRRISGAWGELFLFTACALVLGVVRFFTDIGFVQDVVLAHPLASGGVLIAVAAIVLFYSISVVAGAKRDGQDNAYRARLANAYAAYGVYSVILFAGGLLAVALLGLEFAHDQATFNAQRAVIAGRVGDALAALGAGLDPLASAERALTHLEDAMGEIAISQNLLQDQMNPVFVFAASIFAVNILIVLSPIRSAFMQGAIDLTHILTGIAIGGIIIAGFVSYFLSYSQVIEGTLAQMQAVRPDASLGAWELSRRYNEMIVELNKSRNLLGFAGAIGGEGSGLALFAAAIQFTLERLPNRTEAKA